ncbi:Cys-Gln thioester bond-forming surface protein [Kitasatospora sp. NPDC051705]|uniref:thioester domain-containing protein n=1 Tax=Kitasatospora sp. NPDC051705 TaxID=3364057 RepID=UPI0037B0AB3A
MGEAKDDGRIGGLVKVTTADGGTLFVYCLDARTELNPGSVYREGGRSDVPTLRANPDAGKVNWILQHGYPAVSEGELGELVGGEISPQRAAGATQAAIWRITNHVTGVPWDPVGARLADYLATHAVDAPEPAAPLSLTPGAVSGSAGSVLGPIGITSAGDPVDVSLDPAAVAAGVVLTDRAGKAVSDGGGRLSPPAMSGDSVFVKAPAGAEAGSATIRATASVPAPVGRALVSPDSQDLLLASGADKVVTGTTLAVSWTSATSPPSPTATPSDSASPSAGPTAGPPPSTGPTPSTGPGVTPTTGPGVTPSTGPSPTPSTGPGVTPGVSPSPTPTTGPSVTPGVSPGTAPGAGPSGTPGGVLPSTGASGGIVVAAGAGIGLLLAGGLVVVVHERRRRRRNGV